MTRERKILVLGASSDIGIETVKLFLKKNYIVLAHYNKNKKGLIKINNKNLKLFKYDIKKIFQFEKFIKRNKKLFSGYGNFVNLCGYLKNIKITNASVKDYYDHFNVNYFSTSID